MEADWPDPALNSGCANAGEPRVSRRGIRSAVMHGVRNFHAGWEAVEKETPRFLFQDTKEVSGMLHVGFVGMDGSGELTREAVGQLEEFFVGG